MTVGELAKRTGVTVRALHHYERIGLLPPPARTTAGYRRYQTADVARLQQICSLRQLGFPLAEIRGLLERPEIAPREVIALHLERTRRLILEQERLRERLETLLQATTPHAAISIELLTEAIAAMNMSETYFTAEQRAAIASRGRELGEARIRDAETEWPRLITEVREAIDAGVEPAEPRAQTLAARWMALVEAFTGGDPGIAAGLKAMYERERPADIHPSIDPRIQEYQVFIQRAAGGPS